MKDILKNAYEKMIAKLLELDLIPRFYYLRVINRFILSMFIPKYTMIQGHKIYLDPVDSLRLTSSNIYEPFSVEIISKLLKKGDIALDIGANIGYFTLILANQVGNNGKVYAFEPSPQNCSLLKKNVTANGYKNVIIELKAVSDKSSTIQLYLSLRSSGQHSLFNHSGDCKSTKVQSISLDKYFPSNTVIDFIKMDIQGAEILAFQGMNRLLIDNQDIKLIIEFCPILLSNAGFEPGEYIENLTSFGFSIFDIAQKERKLKKISKKELLTQYTILNGRYTNLLCLRGSLDDYNISYC
jgi:FkbM family methyltransferase